MRNADGNPVAAILTGDLHFSHKAPAARAEQSTEEWYSVQRSYLLQLNRLKADLNGVPILIAGDIFDRWNAPAELINMLLRNWPGRVLAIPGQHDLANHSYLDIRRTAYWTMVEAQAIANLSSEIPIEIPGANPIRLHGFPWGYPVVPLKNNPSSLLLEIALVHDYFWTKDTGYHNAPEEKRLGARFESLWGYDVVVIGDNHKPFDVTLKGGPRVCNVGSFIRRKSDEIGHKPSVGLLHVDGSVTRHYLDVSGDLFINRPEHEDKQTIDTAGFLEELGKLGDAAISFAEAMNHYFDGNGVPEVVRQKILKAMEE